MIKDISHYAQYLRRGAQAWLKQPAGVAAIYWLASRAAYALLIIAGDLLTPYQSQYANHPSASLTAVLTSVNSWDSLWYQIIATNGYTHTFLAGFFPLFPLLIHFFLFLDPGQVSFIAMLISNCALYIALWGIIIWCEQENYSAEWTMRALLAYPFAFFLAIGYSESLFLALAVWALVFARSGRYTPALAMEILAGLSRPSAIVLVFPLAFIAWQKQSLRAWIASIGAGIGVGIYALYCQWKWRDLLAFMHAQSYNAHGFIMPWDAFYTAIQQVFTEPALSYTQVRALIDFLPLAAAIALVIITPQYLRISSVIYVTASLLFILILGPVPNAIFPDMYASAGRYTIALFPLAALVGKAMSRRKWFGEFFMMFGWGMQALFIVFIARGGWLV